jgi:peptide deformylase
MPLPIVQTGNPVLRTPARELTRAEILSRELQELIEQMRETMRAAPGVGLAAPQIGQGLQLVVIEDPPELQTNLSQELLAERQRQPVPFHVLINPKLTVLPPAESVEFFEGCLSVSGFAALTPRSLHVEVHALNQKGEEFSCKATGWYARILQHECDHLQGVLYIDRMHSRSFSTMANKEHYWELPSNLVRERLGF